MTAVKICGITNPEDAIAACDYGADALGFIFFEPSPRYVRPMEVRRIMQALPRDIAKVGVFVNPEISTVRKIWEYCRLDFIQLSGDEPPDFCRQIPAAFLLKVIPPLLEGNPDNLDLYKVRAFMIDSREGGRFGGTGKLSDWKLAKAVGRNHPVVLSGGLSPENVEAAIAAVSPRAVDVSSGIEIAPGKKDHQKMRRFVERVHLSNGWDGAGIFCKPDSVRQKNLGKDLIMKNSLPDRKGHFGIFGGRYVAETLMPALIELEKAYLEIRHDRIFKKELDQYLRDYAGRETPLYFASRLTEKLGGARIYLKREDLNHTGSHKINNTLGQALLARKMGKQRVIAETGAGQHGVATATVAALFGLECQVFMGEEDIARQAPNVFRMKILGAEVVPVASGTATLKDAMNEAMREWVARVRDTYYVIGSTAGPHPYPMMVRDFQSVIGHEAKRQIMKKEGRLPDVLIACVGGGSNAMGLFYPFKDDTTVEMWGVEAGGKGLETGLHAASISAGRIGVLHGNKTYILQDEQGQVRDAHSVAAGLDYPGVGPEHSYFHATGRVRYVQVTDEEAIQAFLDLCRCEGIIPAMESAHAIAFAMKLASKMGKDKILVVNLSGRGDKDAAIIAGKTEDH